MPKPHFGIVIGGSGYYLQFSGFFSYPEHPELESGQRYIRTNGGGIRVQQVGPTYKELTVNISNMTDVDFEGLKDWCENKINWMVEPFTYVDHVGVVRTVRLLMSNLKDFETSYLNNSSGQLKMRVLE